MRRACISILFSMVGFVLPPALYPQISPGELSAPHAHLEGVGNCTKCHALGRSIDNTGCLSCHGEIADRILRRAGLHGGYADRRCVECHKEHHGVNFSIVLFETGRFVHQRAGFDLKGKHAALRCAQCHTSKLIKDPDVRRKVERGRKGTFLGLGQNCVDCHDDAHSGQFTAPCAQCHGSDAWNVTPGFTHEKTAFPLVGKHANVACSQCHTRTGPRNTVQFARLSFGTCATCHQDPHGGRFEKSCESCHSPAGWKSGAASRFDHQSTRFPLKGRHASLACAKCHSNSATTARGRFRPTRFQLCSDCHMNVHKTGLIQRRNSVSCEQCHVESGWKDGAAGTFSHDDTGFPLRGRHKNLPCKTCHGQRAPRTGSVSLIRSGESPACVDCHTDPHHGQFSDGKTPVPCERCHDEKRFTPSVFTLIDHDRSGFPLAGSHRAVPCTECHKERIVGGARFRQFRWKDPMDCTHCHENAHGGKVAPFTKQECRVCHAPVGWDQVQYVHTGTAFVLSGKHIGLACWRCHGDQRKRSPVATWLFRGTPTRCADCHGDGVSNR